MKTHPIPLCPVCTTPASFLMQKDGFDEYLCPICHLSFVFPQPEAHWLEKEVYSYESGYQSNKKADLAALPVDEKSKKILDLLVQRGSPGRLLDVGCSNGHFMFLAREKGFSCIGVELNVRTADIARANGFDVYGGFLEDAPFEKGSFDVIFLGDVIEHVNNPRALVAACAVLLKLSGTLVVSTPNMDCFWSRATLDLYRWIAIPWAPATPPHHLFQFNLDNLNRLLGGEGFSVAESFFVGPPRLMYNLGSLHLFKVFKKEKTLKNFFYMLLAFTLYTVLYGLNTVGSPFLKKDFGMVVFYKKQTTS